ncbi:MAG: hypothetical protein NVS3B10_16530 [Polyangiales bacterium]
MPVTPPPLFVARRQGLVSPLDEDPPTRVLTLDELPIDPRTPVATSPTGRFVGLGDAIDHSGPVRDALLALSPDPALQRWGSLPVRLPLLLAPLAWAVFAAGELRGASELARDAGRLLDSADFKQLEAEPATAKDTKLRRERIERAVGMRGAYAIAEASMVLAGVVVVLAGLRRWRAVPIGLGFGAAFWFLFQAGRPSRCFGRGALGDWGLALLGAGGAIVALAIAPGETRVAADLRARLGLPRSARPGERGWKHGDHYWDVVAALAAGAAALVLPVRMAALNVLHVGNALRILAFVGFCAAIFLAGLSWRRDLTRVAPRLVTLALAASLGFGVLAAADVAVRASFATVVEAQTCAAPGKVSALNKIQEQGSKETTSARRDTQTDLLAFFIAVLAAPLSEEMLYRGTLQRLARRAFGSRIAIMLSGLVFGVAHMGAFHAAFYQHIGLGLAFAAVFELAGGGATGVVASAATHLLWNFWLAVMPVF